MWIISSPLLVPDAVRRPDRPADLDLPLLAVLLLLDIALEEAGTRREDAEPSPPRPMKADTHRYHINNPLLISTQHMVEY
jgi:hypothetical protein